MWTRQGLRDLLERCDPDVDGVVSMHLWAHIWWTRRGWRRPRIHSGLLTESYIRQVDTTYNLLARPYLPKPPGISLASAEAKWPFTPLKKKLKVLLKKLPLMKEIRERLSGRSRDHTDEFLAKFFASLKPKVIVQVGANDGIICDPLRRFLKSPGNYRAVLIEPIPYYFKKLSQLYTNRADISVVNAAMGAEETQKRLYFIPPNVAENMNGNQLPDGWAHGQGSFDYATVVYWIKQNAFRGKEYLDNIPNYISSITYLDVTVKPIRDLIPQAENVLLVIDVQGAEYDVLCGLDWRHPPEYIIIEDDLDQTARAIRLLYYHGYRYVCGICNKVYKRSD
jgi:FkbM family methyltransferase